MGIINFGKLFSKFYCRHYELFSNYDTGLKEKKRLKACWNLTLMVTLYTFKKKL